MRTQIALTPRGWLASRSLADTCPDCNHSFHGLPCRVYMCSCPTEWREGA